MSKGDLVLSIRIEKGDKLDEFIKLLEDIQERAMRSCVELVAGSNFEIIFLDKKYDKEEQ